MKFDERMMMHLKPLAKKFLEDGEYRYLSLVSGMLVGFSSGKWSELGDDAKERYLESLENDFHPRAMGESPSCWCNPDYGAIAGIIHDERRGLIRKRMNN